MDRKGKVPGRNVGGLRLIGGKYFGQKTFHSQGAVTGMGHPLPERKGALLVVIMHIAINLIFSMIEYKKQYNQANSSTRTKEKFLKRLIL